jgi:hypothetical protein
VTITPERFSRLSVNGSSIQNGGGGGGGDLTEADRTDGKKSESTGKPSALAGYVGLFTGCGALVALSLFLPLPARFGEIDGVTPGAAVAYSFDVVAVVAWIVAIFVAFGLRNLQGEDGKGWRVLFGLRPSSRSGGCEVEDGTPTNQVRQRLPPRAYKRHG